MRKKLVIGSIIILIVIINIFLNPNISYSNYVKSQLKKEYGIIVQIEEKEEKNDEINYKLKLKDEKIFFDCTLKKEGNFLIKKGTITSDADVAIKESFYNALKKEHSNLSMDNGCYVLSFEDYSNIEEATLATEHIAEYLQKQKYFQEHGHIAFIRIKFLNSISDETATEVCVGTLNTNQAEFYVNRMYSKDTIRQKIEDKYVSITQQYAFDDPSMPKDLWSNTKLVSTGTTSGKVENYQGYFTFEQAVKLVKDMGYQVFGDEKTFSIYINNNVYEFSNLYIDGPHTYYIYNGDHYTLSNQENMISEEILSKIINNNTQLTFKDYGTIRDIVFQDKNVNETETKILFGMDYEENAPYLYLTDLPKLFDILQISYNKDNNSLYKFPLYEWELDNETYTFDLSYSKYYRKQLGEFISPDDEYWIKNGDFQISIPNFKNNHLDLTSLEIITGYKFNYDNINHSIIINK